MTHSRRHCLASRLLAASLLLRIASCGGGGGISNPAPTPTPPSRAILSATVDTATATRDGQTINYEVVIFLTDTGGVASTLNTTDITSFSGSTNLGSESVDHTPAISPLRIPARGTAGYALTASNDDDEVLITRVELRVNYRDDNGNLGTVTTASDITPPAPPAGGNLVLSGTVKSGSSALADVLIDVRSGANAGRSVRTDGSGKYSLSALAAGTLTLRAAKSGYVSSEKQVNLTASSTVNFELSKSSGVMAPLSVWKGRAVPTR